MPFDTTQDAYVRLRNIIAERTSPIVAWVGSGLSASVEIPTWALLKGRLLAALREKIASYDRDDQAAPRRDVVPTIERQPNPWVAFQMLQEHLGAATYREVIREAVRPAETADPPQVYAHLWRLRIRGLINLNIDRLATKAHVHETKNSAPLEFTGAQGVRLGHLLKATRPFILNLHGHADDSSTWIFTKRELDRLYDIPAYQTFIHSCLSANTVLFVGLSADDRAVGGHLERLARLNIDTGIHYWVTSRADAATDRWAGAVGIRVIRYRAPNDEHAELDEMFADLLGFIPPEDSPVREPVVSTSADRTSQALPAPADLAQKDSEEIRQILNAHALGLLDHPDDYNRFLDTFDEAVYRAWYASTLPGRNLLLGYRLDSVIAKGAFGTVYRATGPADEPLAIIELCKSNRKLGQKKRGQL